MHKILSAFLALSILSVSYAQNNKEIKGITITGIKGINRSIADVIARERPIPLNFRVHLRPELEGPRPKVNPAAKPVSKFGSLVNSNNPAIRTTSTSAPTQTVYSNFLTIWGSYASVSGRESPYTPPDNCGDVGTTQIIATANTRLKVFTKPSITDPASTTPAGSSTTTLSSVVNIDLNTFFTNSSLGINSISDPHVRFDRLSGRWFVVAIEVNHNTNNYCCIAVSDGPTITSSSSFRIFYFNVSGTGGASNDFYDYPTLGVDKNSLYIGGNMFANGNSFSGSNMWVVNKASLLSGTLTLTSFPHGITHTDMYTPQGVHNDDPGAANGYFIGASQTLYSKLVIRRVSYSGSTPSLSGDLNITTSTTYAPKTVPTLGGAAIDGDDERLCAAMIKKNKITGVADLWVAQGTLLNSSGIGGSGGDRDGALWLEIGNLSTTPSVMQAATLYDGVHPASSAVYYTYPTIALSGQGHNIMGFTSAGPGKYAQASVAGRYRTDPAGNFQSPVDFTNTTSTYNPGASRWGDFTQTVVDPSDDMTMWTFTEYAPTTNSWGVRAAQLKAPPPATPALSAIPACGATTTITINGTSTNNSEFFDPGTDAGGPGFNHLKVSVTGPSSITISNVVFVGPTQVNADFNVPANAAAGTYTLTITNPDGQSSTATFNLTCAPPACGDPTGLSSSVTTNSATVSWTPPVSGANSYNVDYKLSSSGTWINVATAITTTSVSIPNLNSGATYDWRVTATCANGSGNYVTAQFTTMAPCNIPSGLSSLAITSSSATISWNTTGAAGYDVQYEVTNSNSWISLPTTSATSVSITGLNSSTAYTWQVRSNCGTSGTSDFASAQFTTAVLTCPDTHEPNNTLATAAAVTAGTDITAQIATATDNDYYSFSSTNSQRRVKVTLTNLPADYDLKLYAKNNSLIATSAKRGTVDETIIYNTNKAGSYKVYVYGFSGAFNSTKCYTLRIQLGVSNFSAEEGVVVNDDDQSLIVRSGMRIYPVPASNEVTVSFDAYITGKREIIITNQLGQKVMGKEVDVSNGINFTRIDVSMLGPGVYFVKVNNGKEIQSQRMVITK